MRLFTAIVLSDAVKDEIFQLVCNMKQIAVLGNFTRRENLHVTLVFLGEVADPTPVEQVLDGLEADAFSLSFSGLGRFRRDGGDICWLGVEPSNVLQQIHSYLHSRLLPNEAQPHRYRPHITLGREVILSHEVSNPGKIAMPVTKISLMKSERIGGRLIYTEIYQKGLRA